MDLTTLLALNAVLALAAFFSALAGFGFALIATPFLVLFLPPQQVVPAVILCWLPLAVALVWSCRKEASIRRYGRLLIGGVLGLPIGVYILAHADAAILRTGIGALTLLATLSIFLKPARPLPREQWLTGGVGFISGILGGASSISGPVVVLFGLNKGWHPRGMRADLLHYFLGSYLVALLMFRKVGVLDVQAVQLGSVAIPGIVAGYFAGMRLKGYLSPLFFRRLALSAITISGLAALLADWC